MGASYPEHERGPTGWRSPLGPLPGYATVKNFMSCSPVNLAVTRIVVFSLLAFLVLEEDPVWFTEMPIELLVPPRGLDHAVRWISLSKTAVGAISLLTVIPAVMAAVGWRTRAAAWFATIGGLYVLTIPQIWGKVNHYHDVLWFALILALSPADHAWSVDAWRRGGPRPNPSLAYGLPLRYVALLLGLIYFFPGLWKLSMGPDWVWSDNLRNQLWLKRMDFESFRPPLPIDDWPLALRMGAAGVIMFELGFLWLILRPKSRRLALLAGAAFHLLTALFMGINFWVVYPCYVALVDWGAIIPPDRSPNLTAQPTLGVRVVGPLLVWLVFFAGVFRFNSWPISVYPQFATIASPIQRTIELELVDSGGRVLPSSNAVQSLREHMQESRVTSVLRRISASTPAVRGRKARAFVRLLQAADSGLADAQLAKIFYVARSADPSMRDHPAISRDLVGIIRLDDTRSERP